MNFLDKADLNGVKFTNEGFLIADAFAARTGIQKYRGYELGVADDVVNVYRPADEVFKRDSLNTFSHVPVTIGHPTQPVTAENWKDLAIGEVSAEVLRDGERLKIPLIVKDKAAIDAVKSGLRELSVGYACDLAFEQGTAPDGTPYQAIQRNIRANHVAIVERGRAGSDFRIGDSDNWGIAPVTKDSEAMNMRTILVDGISIQTTDQGAQAIEKLQGEKGTLVADNLKLVSDHNKAIAAKDEEIGSLKAQLQTAKDQTSNIDRLVADRMTLVDTARAVIKDLDPAGKSDNDIRKAVVVAKLGDDAIVNASDAEILGMFKAVTKDAKPADNSNDPLRMGNFKNGSAVNPPMQISDSQAAYEKRLREAYKQTAAK